MIYLYTGTPGSYKSYHATKEALAWLRSGGNLITNFPIDYSKLYKKPYKGIYIYKPNEQITVNFLLDFAKQNHKKNPYAQTLVIFDEASIKFNTRDFRAGDRSQWITFFANHRHFNFDIILIVQSDIMIDKQIRCLVELEYKHRSVKYYKWLGALLNFFFKGLYYYIDYWYSGKIQNSVNWGLFNKRIAACYDTMALFVDGSSSGSNFESCVMPNGLKCVAPFLYKDVKQEIYQFKFAKMVWKSKNIARKMADTIKLAYPDINFDCVAFVPVSDVSRSERGYDQSEILAKHISELLNIPCVHLLKKIEQRKTQHDLPRSERKENVKNCYECALHSYQNVLLIDDICTTGFTLSECADKIAEYSKCSVFCAAYALSINF